MENTRKSTQQKIVLTVLFTLFQDVCSSFPELSSVSKSYICRNCFRQILNYHTLKQKIFFDFRTSFQVGELQQSLQLPDPPQLHTASSTSSPALTVSKKKRGGGKCYCITLIILLGLEDFHL